MKTVTAALAVALAFGLAGAPVADASTRTPSGCTTPPCGAVKNNADRKVHVRWSNDGEAWKYKWVEPGHQVGGYWHDGLDVDFWEAPSNCKSTWHFEGSDNNHTATGGWVKLESSQTAVITAIKC
ncbi:MAG: hypothetical protein HOV94_02495 [Saccharothrix sp.]|nr:hypothetical protein [Saccharothrix sp.]